MKKAVSENKNSPQAKIIKELNPIIRGWSNYYQYSDIKSVGELSRQDYLLYQKLRRWAYRRCGSLNKGHQKYWHHIGSRNWVFASREGKNPYTLLKHNDTTCSSTDYIKVKGDKSPYDGDLVYWSTRMGQHPECPTRVATLLKKQKGKCPYCGLHFREDDVMEVDHIIPKSLGGKDEYSNLQLLHGHCHDAKTASDGSLKSHVKRVHVE